MNANIILAHPTGNAFSRNAAIGLARHGALAEFWTCIAWNSASVLNCALPERWRDELSRRAFPSEVSSRIHTRPWRELGRLLSGKLQLDSFTAHERGVFSVDAVYRTLDLHVARRLEKQQSVDAIYAYEDGALNMFKVGQTKGSKRIYDLPIGYWKAARQIQRTEAELRPEWAPTLSAMLDSDEKLQRKDDELRLANEIIVASSFTRQTLALAPQPTAKIRMVPYGAPVPVQEPHARSQGKLKVLFVGILSQRKGIAYLFDAVRQMKGAVDLTLVGKPPVMCPALENELKVHRWIPSLPHYRILDEMDAHDVLVFPSLFEGFGLVLLEALSRGVPVITTPHTAGPDIITEGVDGFIVPIRSSHAIVEKLELLDRDRVRLRTMSQAALETARRCTWESYRSGIVDAVEHCLMDRN